MLRPAFAAGQLCLPLIGLPYILAAYGDDTMRRMKPVPLPLAAALLLALSACGSSPKASHDPLSIARAPAAAAINDYQRCAGDALRPMKDDPVQSVFVLADAALAACDAGLERVKRSILADNAGHPYVATFADEASANIRARTRNMLAHGLNRAREAQPAQ